MLDNKTIKKIEDHVYEKPRSIQEIAKHIDKNWRTADRYIEKIKEEFGTISTRIFREGTRGALKIIYASQTDKISHTVFQRELEKKIFMGKKKENFSPFDIYQFVKDKKKSAIIKKGKDESSAGRLKEFKEILDKTKKQILFFSGNLSFINFDDGKIKLFEVLESLIKKGITIKIVSRIDIKGIKNVKKILSLNHKYGKEMIKIKHKEQPLRITIIDNKIINMKEVLKPTGRKEELKEKTFIFYTIKEKEWIEWCTKIFWKMYNSSIGSEKRIKEIEKIRI